MKIVFEETDYRSAPRFAKEVNDTMWWNNIQNPNKLHIYRQTFYIRHTLMSN